MLWSSSSNCIPAYKVEIRCSDGQLILRSCAHMLLQALRGVDPPGLQQLFSRKDIKVGAIMDEGCRRAWPCSKALATISRKIK